MATLAPERSPPSPSRRSNAKRCERFCCTALAHFPLLFVYGLTTWAVWVESNVGFGTTVGHTGKLTSILGILLYLLANASYTIAVFTDPGSPLNSPSTSNGTGYSSLPTHEPSQRPNQTYTSLTAKSSGKPRYCKKCQCLKPDRAHHCSTCGRCVLKMDHHCPWLATCVGLHNYKAFLLFLLYVSLFCWVCFLIAADWIWIEIVQNAVIEENSMVVHTILLAVLAGIIGLVLSGFTGWHVYLAMSGQTTIESLEKTRYLSPLKKSMERQIERGRQYVGQGESGEEQAEPLMDQLKEIHANFLPGVTRPEEGVEGDSNASTPPRLSHNESPAGNSLRRNWAEIEQQREHDRYQEYMDEQDSEKLPHAFDLGWTRNLSHVMGPNKLLWPLPICNTTGDGWTWEVSEDWMSMRDEVANTRLQRQQAAAQSWQNGPSNGFAMPGPPKGAGRHYGAPLVSQATHRAAMSQPAQDVAMHNIDRRKQDDEDEYETSSDEDSTRRPNGRALASHTANWNDIPDDFLSSRREQRSSSRGRQKDD